MRKEHGGGLWQRLSVRQALRSNSTAHEPSAYSPFCAGVPVSVPYTVVGTYNAGNTFTAQLSDATGSFASPVSIGSLSSTTAGSHFRHHPAVFRAVRPCRIRVVSSDPGVTGSDNGSDISIGVTPTGWTQRASLSSTGRSGAIAFSIGSTGYMGTGHDGSNYLRDFWAYGPRHRRVDPKGRLRRHCASVPRRSAWTKRGYAGCGDDGGIQLPERLLGVRPGGQYLGAMREQPGPGTGRSGPVAFSISSKAISPPVQERPTCWSTIRSEQLDRKAPLLRPLCCGRLLHRRHRRGCGAQGTPVQRLLRLGMIRPRIHGRPRLQSEASTRVYASAFQHGPEGLGDAGVRRGRWCCPGLARGRMGVRPGRQCVDRSAFVSGNGKSIPSAFGLNGKGYFGTGLDGIKYNDFWGIQPGE
ncbi:MAG: hypothetical protein U0V45_05080 [Flavobacteriales bacterium]